MEDDEEDEEVRRRKTVSFLKKLEREGKQNSVSDIEEVEVNEAGKQLDPTLVEKAKEIAVRHEEGRVGVEG